MSNLQIELKRHKLNQQFLEQVEFGNHSQGSISETDAIPLKDKGIGVNRKGLSVKDFQTPKIPHEGCSIPDTHLDLQDTEHQELKVGVKKNGQKYSVRTNRKRFFYPNEWNNFYDNICRFKFGDDPFDCTYFRAFNCNDNFFDLIVANHFVQILVLSQVRHKLFNFEPFMIVYVNKADKFIP